MFKKAITLLLVSSQISQSFAQEATETPVIAQEPTEQLAEAVAEEQAPQPEPLTEFQQKQVDHLMNQIDFDVIENSVKDKLTQEILEKQFRQELEDQMNNKVQDIVAQYQELEQKWNQLDEAEIGNVNKYQGLTLKQMLKSIMENLNTDHGRKELWKNSNPEDSENLQNLNLDINLETGEIKIKSKTMEPDGALPLFEFDMNTNTGSIEEITRKGNKERIVERDVNPDTLKISDDFFNIQLPKTDISSTVVVPGALAPSTKVITAPAAVAPVSNDKVIEQPEMTTADQREWDNMEMQRDVAFKIMYFFIVFIIATFGLLYTYFKMSQKVEEDARREEMGMSRQAFNKQDLPKETFFDFLQGNMDNETYIGNPHARANMQRMQSENPYQQTPNNMPRNAAMNAHRDDSGFGANNLESLIGGNDGESHDLQRQATFYKQ